MKHPLLTLSFFLSFTCSFSQNITAKIMDAKTKAPIPYANIKTGAYSGVISNDEGFFSLNSENPDTTVLNISCLGYKSETLTIKDLKANNYVIKLHEAFNQLDEIYISNKRPNADDIIAKVREKINDNYDFTLNKYNIFYRATDYANFKNLDFEIDKASHVSTKNTNKVNYSLDSLSKNIIASKIISFSDFKGEFSQLDKDSSKLAVAKATKLLDHKKDFSVERIQEKTQELVLKYLDTTKTYKLKSGIFKIEDSLSLVDKKFKEFKKNEHKISALKTNTKALIKGSQFYDGSLLYTILNPDLYNYTLEDITYYNDDLTYIIHYQPRKSKAKYAGKIIINSENYAVTKLDYSYYKSNHGSKFNMKLLLGIKYVENLRTGTILYQKNSENKYHPKYITQTLGSYFYVSRSLKFIENSRAKNKIGINFKIEGDNRNKQELLVTTNSKLSLNDFNLIKEVKTVPVQILKKFESSTWGNDEILEPLEEMKKFNGSE
ncbi:carboxypeptidase-like regulatory domain-containing protein [Mariniflexile gromovii]|uniref:Carboxypeptidase-like regulatory domain-containing protein n=1 Tax=Mariniflexile gromovii TaxID=362523 RepID=A0ABS4BSV6_9FLAO|nr:carboxypeptidase-like regulatory domain-containing protein [Mariniflexile gromovii]MBP0903637.1 carboxypeptidase-like regulatory domain-containing protein [Mariniflexile gromovii]